MGYKIKIAESKPKVSEVRMTIYMEKRQRDEIVDIKRRTRVPMNAVIRDGLDYAIKKYGPKKTKA